MSIALDPLGVSPLVYEIFRGHLGKEGRGQCWLLPQELQGRFMGLTVIIMTVPHPSAPVLVAGTKG